MRYTGIIDLVNAVHESYNLHKCQGHRSDLAKENSILTAGKVGTEFGLSSRTVCRYLRLYYLNDKFKEYVNLGKISVRVGVEISYLADFQQEWVACLIEEGYVCTYDKAVVLRKLMDLSLLTKENVRYVCEGDVPRTLSNIREKIMVKCSLLNLSENEFLKLIYPVIEAKTSEDYKVKW